ncbi:serine hydrolase [Massilia glaciei]|uniref:Serine hydrolase n=1 Tax=Massilia glaciei TaxID=1524097 RepID=A0A2U2I6Z4_9BURK|nr:serine hydrolase [Massilia glaciei]
MLMGAGLPLLSACGGGGGGEGAPPKELAHEDVGVTTIAADDWATAAPESQGIPAAAMQAMLDDGAGLPTLRALLVVRNGKLVGERYYADCKSSDLRHIRSATKTVCSLLVGQALRDGKISGIDATLRELLPAQLARVPLSAAGDITLRQVLQMRAGLDWSDDRGFNYDDINVTDFALALPVVRGAPWSYNSGASHLLSPILSNAYGSDLLTIAQRNLFEPLGIKQVLWARDASGAEHGSYGLRMRPRDLMKLAAMNLDGGQWQGRSIVPAQWLAQSQLSHFKFNPLGLELDAMGYGYLWWTGALGGHDVAMYYGWGGQLAIVVPALRMAVTTTALWRVGDTTQITRGITAVVARLLAKVTPA